MYDPTSTVSAPPPRYLLESDSSDEEGQGAYAGQRVPKLRVSAPDVTLRPFDGSDAAVEMSVETAIVGVGQAGTYLLRGARGAPAFTIQAGEDRLGTGVRLPEGLLVAVKEEGDWGVVRALLGAVTAESWIVVSTYLPALYVPEPGEAVGAPAVRALPPAEGLSSYAAPNYVTGVAGAFLSLAAHPASKLDVSLRLLPLPLSGLPRTALSALPVQLARPLWTEADDAPFLAPGMGKRPSETRGEDTGGMYM